MSERRYVTHKEAFIHQLFHAKNTNTPMHIVS
jgi:hypothetical protein